MDPILGYAELFRAFAVAGDGVLDDFAAPQRARKIVEGLDGNINNTTMPSTGGRCLRE